MPRQVCLAETDRDNTADKVCKYSIVERVPLLLKEHAGIWESLTTCAEKRLVVEAGHPEDEFDAYVLNLAAMTGASRKRLEDAVAIARDAALEDETVQRPKGPFSKGLNRSYDQQREWLALRSVLVQGLGQTPASSPSRPSRKQRRILVMIDG